MRAAIYNPYLDTLGGGERYTLAFAKVLADANYSVDLQWVDDSILNKLESRFGIKIRGLRTVGNINRGDGYDLCFWVSDGSIPLLKARNNILHFQVPFTNVSGRSLLNKMKLFRINTIVCNSNFTKQIIDEEFGVKSLVVYPPVDIKPFRSGKKKNEILSVGRFSVLLQSKRHDVLIKAFRKFYDDGKKDWKLILAGGAEIGDKDLVDKLKEESAGYPVEIIKSPDFKKLQELYSTAKIFWSASGFGVNDLKEPHKAEHFGITLVEAQSFGAVPLAFNAGGHREIITDGENGYLWNTEDELIEKTNQTITSNSLYRLLVKNCTISSRKFSFDVFKASIVKII